MWRYAIRRWCLEIADSVDIIADGYDVRSLGVSYPNGFVIGEHTHPWGQLVYCMSGVMQVTASDVVWFVPSTRALWLPPKVKHHIVMQGEVDMRTLYLSLPRATHLPLDLSIFEVSPLLGELILAIQQIGMLEQRNKKHSRLAAVLIDLVCEAPLGDLRLALPKDARAAALARWFQNNPASQTALKTIAVQHGRSLRTLQRLFVRETGMSLDAWRQKARLIHAVTRLITGDSVTNAGFNCGYKSTSAFIVAFKKQFGVTPGRY